MTETFQIRWPDYNHPRNCPIHVQNELEMGESPERIWAWLTHATHWPTWYANAANVQILDSPEPAIKSSEPKLEKDAQFRWKTMGITVNCRVVEFVANERIAWSGRAYGIDVYHAWILMPSDQGCRVQTEETQRGLLAGLGKGFLPNQMFKAHQLWLECLKSKAQSGLPLSA